MYRPFSTNQGFLMRTVEALPILQAACGVPFRELFKGHPHDLTTNKGHAGQLLEKYVGLKSGSHLTDFEDGDLKTNKTAPDGTPLETIAVTQIGGTIEGLVSSPPRQFLGSPLAQKLDNLLIVSIVKQGSAPDWYLLDVYHISLARSPILRAQFESDYLEICSGMRSSIMSGGSIKTTNGKYLQIRSKDSAPYKPIYSKEFGRAISNKNYAFYLQKIFVQDIISGRLA